MARPATNRTPKSLPGPCPVVFPGSNDPRKKKPTVNGPRKNHWSRLAHRANTTSNGQNDDRDSGSPAQLSFLSKYQFVQANNKKEIHMGPRESHGPMTTSARLTVKQDRSRLFPV